MELQRVDWADGAAVRAYVDAGNAVLRADAPWRHPWTERKAVGDLRWGWDGDPSEAFLAVDGGRVVGLAEYETSSYDNQHLAWLGVDVHPDHRRRGHGTAVLELLVGRARAEGRTSVGIGGWDDPVPAAFAARHGLEARSVEVNRRMYIDGRLDLPVPEVPDYELVRWPSRTPDADLPQLAELTAAINDAPNDDLDIEDEVYTVERVAQIEICAQARGDRLYRVVARHRETGQLAGQTVVVVSGERPHLAEQDDTSVVRRHRGHRLGLALKLEMLAWLAAAEPQVREVDTWNAESNDHMIGVNELLGYRVLGRQIDYQRSI